MAPPNIVIIMTDQQRADFTSAEGFALDTTPFLDSLGRRGQRFRRAYTPMPVCAPARCSLFTGRFPKATRVRQNSAIKSFFRTTDLVEVLRRRGYSINLVGKNHSYLQTEDFDFLSLYTHRGGGRPDGRSEAAAGFDEWLRKLWFWYSPAPTPFPLEAHTAYRMVTDAIECLDRSGDRPFFLWLSFPDPHPPYQAPEPYFSLFPPEEFPERLAEAEAGDRKGWSWRWQRGVLEHKVPGFDRRWRQHRSLYCGMIRLLDDQVRRFVQHLDGCGLLENTLLIFTSDHGDFSGDYGQIRKGPGLAECLIRVPLIVVGPGVVAGDAAREDCVSLVDVMPTVCDMLGEAIPFGVQGRSLWPMLTGGDYPREEFRSIYAEAGFGGLFYAEGDDPPVHVRLDGPGYDSLNCVTQGGTTKMVRMGKWKLVFDMMGRGLLYDLDSDPAEVHDRYDDPSLRDVRLAMAEELLKWTIRTEDDLPGGAYVPKQAQRNWYARYPGSQ